jgi:hypothetical protein
MKHALFVIITSSTVSLAPFLSSQITGSGLFIIIFFQVLLCLLLYFAEKRAYMRCVKSSCKVSVIFVRC